MWDDPEQRDEFPSSAEVSDHRDGFPRALVMEYSEYSDSVLLRDFHTAENSERVRESDSGVQIVPASGKPIRAERSSNGSGRWRVRLDSRRNLLILLLVLLFLLLMHTDSSRLQIVRSFASMVSQVLGKKVLRDQLLTMGLFQRYRGLMGTLRERL